MPSLLTVLAVPVLLGFRRGRVTVVREPGLRFMRPAPLRSTIGGRGAPLARETAAATTQQPTVLLRATPANGRPVRTS